MLCRRERLPCLLACLYFLLFFIVFCRFCLFFCFIIFLLFSFLFGVCFPNFFLFFVCFFSTFVFLSFAFSFLFSLCSFHRPSFRFYYIFVSTSFFFSLLLGPCFLISFFVSIKTSPLYLIFHVLIEEDKRQEHGGIKYEDHTEKQTNRIETSLKNRQTNRTQRNTQRPCPSRSRICLPSPQIVLQITRPLTGGALAATRRMTPAGGVARGAPGGVGGEEWPGGGHEGVTLPTSSSVPSGMARRL